MPDILKQVFTFACISEPYSDVKPSQHLSRCFKRRTFYCQRQKQCLQERTFLQQNFAFIYAIRTSNNDATDLVNKCDVNEVAYLDKSGNTSKYLCGRGGAINVWFHI